MTRPSSPSDAQAGAVAAKLRQAIELHRRGALVDAEALYRDILAAAPAHFDALHLLGVVQLARGRPDDAVALIAQAIAIDPAHAGAHSNLGLALQKAKRLPAAVASFDRALALRPDHAATHYNRGNALRELGRGEEALASFERALALAPEDANVLVNRGNALRDLQRPDAALASYDRALALRPADGDAWVQRGRVLQDLDRPRDALASFDRALAATPDDADAHYARGNALLALKLHQEALASYDRALALKPRQPQTLNNRGIALLGLGRYAEAVASYDHALALEPDRAEVLANRGNALLALRRPADAVASFDRALALKPDYADAVHGLGSALHEAGRDEEAVRAFDRLLALAPDYPYARGQLLHARMCSCDWTGLAPLAAGVAQDIAAGKRAAEPFGYQGIGDSPRLLRRCAEIYAADRFPPAPAPLWSGERYDHARIRVGYLSGEFRHQATSILMAELFELHDRRRFELFAFDNGWDDGTETRRRVVRAFDQVVDISALTDAAAAAAVHDRRIDILVNLNGWFGRARQGVFALRPAPVQVNYLGFPGTIGADCIDYIVADPVVIPPAHDAFYTERVVRLPETYQVNDRRRRIAERTPDRAELGLPEAGFVFCCFNNNFKITPATFDVWMRLLRQVPGSVLWLLEDNPAAARNLRREAAARGVPPERLVFAPRVPLPEHLARHRQADLFLDTLPCNAHTTASDALWAGLPVLTVLGGTFPGRVAASLLAAAGLPDLVAPSLDAYAALAGELATSPARLAALRARLARNRDACPLFDTDRFRRHLEAAYVGMWERQRRGEAPAAFAVPPVADTPCTTDDSAAS